LAICLLPAEPTVLMACSFAFGLFAFTLYPLSSALANSRVSDEDRVGVSSALLMVFGAGAAFGSAIISKSMTFFGPKALYASIAVLTVLMFGVLTFINSRQKVEQPEASDYVVGNSDVTSSPLAAAMDPRIEEEIAHEQLLVVESDEESKVDDSSSDEFKEAEPSLSEQGSK